MPFKPKVQLFTCKTCGKPFNNALAHVCKIRMDKPPRRAIKKKVAAKKTKPKKRR